MSSKYSDDSMLSTEQLAEVLNLSVSSLVNMRIQKKGPPFMKMGKGINCAVRYNWGEFVKWRDANTFNSTKEHQASA